MKKHNKRLVSMDMLKGFAIFMVIVGHAVQYLVSGDYWDKGVYRVIYSFHMPLFMTIIWQDGSTLMPFPKDSFM